MGIKSLNKFLRNNCNDVYEEIHISEYSYKKIAIDTTLYLCKFKTICGDRWLTAFVNLIACLRRNDIHCVFIYDSGAPEEKDAERQARRDQRDKTEDRIFKLEEALNEYHTTGEINPILIELDKSESPKRLLSKEKKGVNMYYIENKINKMKNQLFQITENDFILTKKLFDILKVPYYDAPMEAETMCADLCKRGLVDAVLSEDSDVLAYESPIFLSKIDTKNDTCVRIQYNHVLESLQLTSSEFLDFCIMCGTDYNKNIFRVGPEKAFKHIEKYRTIEEIEKNTNLDTSILNHIRGRDIFLNYEKHTINYIEYCGIPNFLILDEFIHKHNIRSNIANLKKSFEGIELIIEDE